MQNSISRLFGYAVIIENGFALLALSLGNQTGYEILVGSLFPRIVALALWSLSMAILNAQGIGMKLSDLRGLGTQYPVVTGALLISIATLAGLPLLAGFPMRQAVIEAVSRQSLPASLWVLLGSMGFMVSGFRVLLVFTQGGARIWEVRDKLYPSIMLSIGGFGLILAGILPNISLTLFLNLLPVFERLK
jgi:NADH-quinone oxidoreductase subunit N